MQMVGGAPLSTPTTTGGNIAWSAESPREASGAASGGPPTVTQPSTGQHMSREGGHERPSPNLQAHANQPISLGGTFTLHNQQPGMQYCTTSFGQQWGYQQIPSADLRTPGRHAVDPSGSAHQRDHHYYQQQADPRYMQSWSGGSVAPHAYPPMTAAPAAMMAPRGYPQPTHAMTGDHRGGPHFAALGQDGVIVPSDSEAAGAAGMGGVVKHADDAGASSELSEREDAAVG
jgi:hypothetical protein